MMLALVTLLCSLGCVSLSVAFGEPHSSDIIARAFLEKLAWFATTARGTQVPVAEIDNFIDSFLPTFVQPAFQPSRELLSAFVEQSPVIANLVRLSSHLDNTDKYLNSVAGSWLKQLALYSVDNGVELDLSTMFSVGDPKVASLWVTKTLSAFSTRLCCRNGTRQRLERLLLPLSELQDLDGVGAYFGSSYIDEHGGKLYKQAANAQVREAVASIYVPDRPSLLGGGGETHLR